MNRNVKNHRAQGLQPNYWPRMSWISGSVNPAQGRTQETPWEVLCRQAENEVGGNWFNMNHYRALEENRKLVILHPVLTERYRTMAKLEEERRLVLSRIRSRCRKR